MRVQLFVVIPYNAMKLYVYILKRLALKGFEIFKNIPSNCRLQFSDFFSKISAIYLSTDRHIKCIVCICVSFLCSCLTFETLHYPWIPSSCLLRHIRPILPFGYAPINGLPWGYNPGSYRGGNNSYKGV